jgi:hypothetical protein
MTPQQAKQLCIEAHKGQWRRPSDDLTDKELDEALSIYDGESLSITLSNGVVAGYIADSHWVAIRPYHTHPIAVADMMTTDEEKILGYLHDVIEDTEYYLNPTDRTICSPSGMNMHLDTNIFLSLCHMTKEKNQSYEAYINQISCDKLATKVKISDIYHNLSCNPSKHAKEKYLKAIPILLGAL